MGISEFFRNGAFQNGFGKIFRNAPAVGIDIGSHSVKVVVLRKDQGSSAGFSATAGEFPLGSGSHDSSEQFDRVCYALSVLRDDFGIGGGKTAFSISGGAVFTTALESPEPFAGRESAQQAVLLHLERFFPGGMDGYRNDFSLLPDDGSGKVLVAVAKKDALHSRLSALSSSGFSAAVADYDGFALINSYSRARDLTQDLTKGGLTILLNVGSRVTNLAILRGLKPVLTRDLSYGSHDVTAAIAALDDITEEEAEAEKISLCDKSRPEFLRAARDFAVKMAHEVKSNVDMFADGGANGQTDKVVFSGGGSLLHGFCGAFSEALPAGFEYADPLKDVCAETDENYLKEMSPKSAVAFGLALRMI